MTERPRVAVFRPADERIDRATDLLESLDTDPVPDPMLAVDPTMATPQNAEFVILTSKTGVELANNRDWTPDTSTLICIGPGTAAAARDVGWSVDLIPDTYSSAGLVEALRGAVDDVRVEVARSDHGSDVLIDGLQKAGADVSETVLYNLVRPETAGHSTELAAEGALAAAAFTSSLTVDHFVEAAAERGISATAIAGLDEAIVGSIGEPTAESAAAAGISVDVIPEKASFDTLARAVVDAVQSTE